MILVGALILAWEKGRAGPLRGNRSGRCARPLLSKTLAPPATEEPAKAATSGEAPAETADEAEDSDE